MSRVEVSKVSIKIGKKTVELSLAEAKELQQILNDTFGQSDTGVTIIPSSPIIIERPIYERPRRYWYVTYGSNIMSLTANVDTEPEWTTVNA